MKRVVGRECEASCVHEELAADVEEDQEEVERAETEDDIDLWYGGLLLEVLERWILGQLPKRNQYDSTNIVVLNSTYLSRFERWYCALPARSVS